MLTQNWENVHGRRTEISNLRKKVINDRVLRKGHPGLNTEKTIKIDFVKQRTAMFDTM